MQRLIFTALACLFSVSVIGQVSNECDSLIQITMLNPGPFNVSSIDESDNIRNGPDYAGATIYYPTNTSGTLSSIVLAPGFMNFESTLQNWGPFLSSHGIVTMTIGTNALTDTPNQRKAALLDALITLKAEQDRVASPLYNSLDTNSVALGGFSMGGGGAQLAAVSDSTIKAVIALYPYLSNASEEILDHNSPLLIISGELDFIAVPTQHANIHYNVTPSSTPKQRYEIQYAIHDPLSGPNGGNGEAGTKVLLWLKSFLTDSPCYCPPLLTIPATASDFIHNIVCEDLFIQGCTNNQACNYSELATIDNDSCLFIGDPCDDENPNTLDDEIQDNCECAGTPHTIADELEALAVLIYPNPASNNLTIDLGALTGLNTTIKLYDSSSKLVFEKQSTSTLLIDVSGYAKGLYTLELSTSDKVLRSQVVIE
jgi:hypothetical protein